MFTSLVTTKPKQSKVVTFDDMVAPWLLQQERWRQEDEQKASSATSPSDPAHPQQGRKAFRKIGIVAIKRVATRLLRRTQKADVPTSTIAAASSAAVPTPFPTLVPTLVSPPVTCTSSEDVPTSSATGPTTLPNPGNMASSPAADNGLMQCAQGTSADECTVPSPTASSHPSTLEPATPATDAHLCDGSKSAISDFVLESSAVKIELALQETADDVFYSYNPEDERRPGSPAVSVHEAPDATLEPTTTSDSVADDQIEDVSSAMCPAPSPIAPTVAHPASSVTTSAEVEAHPASIATSMSSHPSSTTTADTAVEAYPASIAKDGPLVAAQSASGMESDLAGSIRPGATDGSAAEAPLASSASPVGSSAVSEVHGPSVNDDTSVNATVDSDVQEISLVAPEVWNSCYMRDEGTYSLSDLTGSEDMVRDHRRCWEAEEIMGKSDRSSSSHSPSGSFLYIPQIGSSTRDATADDADIPAAAASTDKEDLAFGSLQLGDGGSESGAHFSESEDWYRVETPQVVGSRGHIESGYLTASRTGERAQVAPLGPQGLPARHSPAQPNWAGVHPMSLHTPPHRLLPPSQPRFMPESNWAAVNPAPLHPPLPHPNWPGFMDGRFNMAIGNHRPLYSPPLMSPQPAYAPGGFNPAAVYHPPVHAPHPETPDLAVTSGAWHVPGHDGLLPHQLHTGNGPRAAAGPQPPSPQRPYNRQQKNNGAQTYGRGNQQMDRKQQQLAKSRNRPFDFIECIPTI